MKTNRHGALMCAFLFASVLSLSLESTFAQGSLTPPSAPTPTMKTLDQITSAGIAINSTNTPAGGGYTYVISNPGSYFLTGNLPRC